jgi:hypothetical protein
MKTINTNQKLIKVKSIFNQDIVYTSSEWQTKEIDGVTFVAVKVRPEDKSVKWMRKDNLQKVK